MTKNDIVDYIVDKTNLRRSQAIVAADCVFQAISNSLIQGECVFIRGFATFKALTSKPKMARNIVKQEVIHLPARRTAKLVLCNELKSKMNKDK